LLRFLEPLLSPNDEIDELVGIVGNGSEIWPVFGDAPVEPGLLGLQLRQPRFDLKKLLIHPAQIIQRRRRVAGTIWRAGSFRITHQPI
jgi:hypothetical protein